MSIQTGAEKSRFIRSCERWGVNQQAALSESFIKLTNKASIRLLERTAETLNHWHQWKPLLETRGSCKSGCKRRVVGKHWSDAEEDEAKRERVKPPQERHWGDGSAHGCAADPSHPPPSASLPARRRRAAGRRAGGGREPVLCIIDDCLVSQSKNICIIVFASQGA